MTKAPTPTATNKRAVPNCNKANPIKFLHFLLKTIVSRFSILVTVCLPAIINFPSDFFEGALRKSPITIIHKSKNCCCHSQSLWRRDQLKRGYTEMNQVVAGC